METDQTIQKISRNEFKELAHQLNGEFNELCTLIKENKIILNESKIKILQKALNNYHILGFNEIKALKQENELFINNLSVNFNEDLAIYQELSPNIDDE